MVPRERIRGEVADLQEREVVHEVVVGYPAGGCQCIPTPVSTEAPTTSPLEAQGGGRRGAKGWGPGESGVDQRQAHQNSPSSFLFSSCTRSLESTSSHSLDLQERRRQ